MLEIRSRKRSLAASRGPNAFARPSRQGLASILPHIQPLQSARSFTRATSVAPCRLPFERPAIPIDITAFWYHWSALKTARLVFSFAGRVRESDFLARVDREVTFFDIISTRFPRTPSDILAGVPSR